MLFYSALFYLFVLLLRGLVFLFSHVPAASALDRVVLGLVSVEGVLMAPKNFLRWLWPAQATPAFLNLTLTILNSLLWGIALNVLTKFLRKRSS